MEVLGCLGNLQPRVLPVSADKSYKEVAPLCFCTPCTSSMPGSKRAGGSSSADLQHADEQSHAAAIASFAKAHYIHQRQFTAIWVQSSLIPSAIGPHNGRRQQRVRQARLQFLLQDHRVACRPNLHIALAGGSSQRATHCTAPTALQAPTVDSL